MNDSTNRRDPKGHTAAKKEAQAVLDGLYKEHTGLTDGPVVKALNEMNDEVGLTNPYCRAVKNMGENWIDDIPPGGFGVMPSSGGGGKFMKPVKIIKDKKASNDKEVKTDG
jgi:hypothetical protein